MQFFSKLKISLIKDWLFFEWRAEK